MKLSEKVTSPVVVVSNDDDWEALYVNGVSVTQEHSIRRDELIDVCLKHGQKPCYVTSYYDDLDIQGRYPDNLDDIPEYQHIC